MMPNALLRMRTIIEPWTLIMTAETAHRIMAASTTAEADTLKEFIPDLVTAICDCVQSVSDQCLSKGLISQAMHERVLESRGTSKEQARTLILSSILYSI
jgi:hypothetical protein